VQVVAEVTVQVLAPQPRRRRTVIRVVMTGQAATGRDALPPAWAALVADLEAVGYRPGTRCFRDGDGERWGIFEREMPIGRARRADRSRAAPGGGSDRNQKSLEMAPGHTRTFSQVGRSPK
jgi:hypothetical protein